jgi:hypothetical protein
MPKTKAKTKPEGEYAALATEIASVDREYDELCARRKALKLRRRRLLAELRATLAMLTARDEVRGKLLELGVITEGQTFSPEEVEVLEAHGTSVPPHLKEGHDG